MSEALDLACNAIRSDDKFAVAKAQAMVVGYHHFWQDMWKDYRVLDVELEFTFPLINPDTEGVSRSFVEAGKIDAKLQRRSTGAVQILEHKTTTDDIDPASDYWDRLRMDTQVSKYFLSAVHAGDKVDGVIYDVLHKPGQRPTKIPLRDTEGRKIVLDRNGQRVMTKDGKKPRETPDVELGYELQTRPETPDEYYIRIGSEIQANPTRYYAQKHVTRLDEDLIEYMNDAWQLSQQVLFFRQKSLWPRNPNACKAYNATCEYFDLCCGRASVDGFRYGKAQAAHAELKTQSAGDRELLTNSRCTAFRKCPRYHQLKYEMMVKKIQDDEATEALRLGTLVHLGLEAYFNTLKRLNP
jgi:hypothetical protein